eukprot:9618650-Lingulodinium_polyedra.AAC.1
MGRQQGPVGVLLSFYGRHAADRKYLAAQMEKTRNSRDCWITYMPTKRLGRRVAWASVRREA